MRHWHSWPSSQSSLNPRDWIPQLLALEIFWPLSSGPIKESRSERVWKWWSAEKWVKKGWWVMRQHYIPWKFCSGGDGQEYARPGVVWKDNQTVCAIKDNTRQCFSRKSLPCGLGPPESTEPSCLGTPAALVAPLLPKQASHQAGEKIMWRAKMRYWGWSWGPCREATSASWLQKRLWTGLAHCLLMFRNCLRMSLLVNCPGKPWHEKDSWSVALDPGTKARLIDILFMNMDIHYRFIQMLQIKRKPQGFKHFSMKIYVNKYSTRFDTRPNECYINNCISSLLKN